MTNEKAEILREEVIYKAQYFRSGNWHDHGCCEDESLDEVKRLAKDLIHCPVRFIKCTKRFEVIE